jgi:hyperosmotically inducible periplasmic protein
MKALARKVMISLAAVTLLGALAMAQPASAGRYDSQIQQQAIHKLADKKQFRNVQASVEDGIVTLRGTVDLYQDKLEAAKKVRKTDYATGVRNLIEVAGANVRDAQLQSKLNEKLHYDRVGYDNAFNYLNVSVRNGVATVSGETLNDVGRDSALAVVQRMPGVKDVVNNIAVSPVSTFDDSVRVRALQALYNDPQLGKYSTDPALPIRIIVDRGTLSLYGTVDSPMDKQIAGMRANQVFGAFRVENHLTVANAS